MNKNGWKLDRLTINYRDYGEHEGKHCGSITFKNGNSDSFVMQLTPEKVEQYMDLIRRDIVDTASEIGKLLANSLAPTNSNITGKHQN